MAMPPDVGVGTSWEERSFGMSIILNRLIITQQIVAASSIRQMAKIICVSKAFQDIFLPINLYTHRDGFYAISKQSR